ncbi:MAG: FecR domain-containing protein [Xanthomonadales bacterium]|nr:FecR domain-containing protein [Xanthomonadales bacterium]
MKRTTTDHSDAERNPSSDPLAPLFRHADARPRPPAADEAQVRAAVRAKWQRMTQRRRQRIAGFALAATIVLAVSVVLLLPATKAPIPAGPLATVSSQSGEILVRAAGMPDGAARPLAQSSLASGEWVRTGEASALAVTWTDGTSLRLDANTELRLVSAQVIELLDGRVYVDTGPEQRAPAVTGFEVHTRAGTVRHIGTQYLVALSAARLAVSVREGRVELHDANESATANQGEQLVLTGAGTLQRHEIRTHGELWHWAEQAAPPLELDGMSAATFVQWAARETGRAVSYRDEAARALAEATRLHGTVTQAPTHALELMLQTSDLEQHVINGTISIGVKGERD